MVGEEQAPDNRNVRAAQPCRGDSRVAHVGLLAIAVALGAILYALGRQPELKTHVPEFIALSLAAGAFYLVGVYFVERVRLGRAGLVTILGSAVVFRLCLLPSQPQLSDDVYRYQWEGRVERAHINPYEVFPELPGVRSLADPRHPLANRGVRTLYPPLSEAAFSWVKTVAGYKRLFTALDLGSVGLLLLLLATVKQPLQRVLVYAWNPTVLVSFALCGHHDSLAILTLLAANLLILAHQRVPAVVFLALSFLAKFFPLALLPIFLQAPVRRTAGDPVRAASPVWLGAGVFAAAALLGYLPYFGAGRKLFGGLPSYAAGWEANDSFFRLVLRAWNSKAQAELVVGVMALALVAYALKKRIEPLGASLLVTAGVVMLSPTAFPWYFTWSVPFLCVYPCAPWLLMSVAAVLGYSPVVAYAAGQPYRDSPFILALEYVPVYLWLAIGLVRRARARRVRLTGGQAKPILTAEGLLPWA